MRIMRILVTAFVNVFLIGTVANLNAQSIKKPISRKITSKPAAAGCVLIEAPRLRGFHLGQTVDEISRLIPSFREAYDYQETSRSYDVSLSDWEREINLAASTEINLVSFDSSSAFGIDSSKKLLTSSDFEDVRINWWFRREKLFAYQIYYTEFEIDQDARKFIKQISEKTILPEKGWRILWQGMAAELTCNGFKVFINSAYRNVPSMTISDLKAEAEIVRLAKAIETRAKAEEQERLRLERQKRSTFKP